MLLKLKRHDGPTLICVHMPLVCRTKKFEAHPEVKLHQFALAKEPGEMRMAYV